MFEEKDSGLFWLADWKTDQPGDERRGAAEDYNPAALMALMREEVRVAGADLSCGAQALLGSGV